MCIFFGVSSKRTIWLKITLLSEMLDLFGGQTWKKKIYVYSEILGVQICPKKRENCDKFEIATKQQKSNI